MQGPVKEGRQGALHQPFELFAAPAVQHKQTDHGHEGKDMRGRQERDGVNDLRVRAEKVSQGLGPPAHISAVHTFGFSTPVS